VPGRQSPQTERDYALGQAPPDRRTSALAVDSPGQLVAPGLQPESVLGSALAKTRTVTGAMKRIERLYGGPYLEVFGRKSVQGWTVWSNEVPRTFY
jgi:hypothetical protein